MRIDDENKVVVPDFVAEYINKAKADKCSLDDVFAYDSIQGELADEFLKWLFDNDDSENEKRFLLAVNAWVEGYTIEQLQKYYWRKKEKYSVWFEVVEDTYLAQDEDDGELTFGWLEGAGWKCKFTEAEARDLLKDDFDKFEKVECR